MVEARTRVLLIEDNAVDARLLHELLKEVPAQAFEVTTAARLADALPLLSAHDVVLLDLSLPDAHGVGTIARVAEVKEAPPVIVLTGNTDEQVALQAVSLGADDYLLKTEISPSLVARTILYAIERRRGVEKTQKMLALEIARLESERGAERARFLGDLSASFATTLAIDEIARTVTHHVVPTLGEYCALHVTTQDDEIERMAVHGASESLAAALERLGELDPRRAGSLAARAAAEGRSLALPSLSAALACVDEELAPGSAQLRGRAALVLPLMARAKLVGVLTLVLGADMDLDDDRRRLADEVARRTVIALENAFLHRATERALRARDEIMAIVSHDLRNPLSIMTLSLRAVQRAVESGTMPRLEAIGRGLRASSRMERLINDLLDVACIEAGKFAVTRVPLDLGGLLREVVEQNAALALEKRVRLETRLEASGKTQGDRDRLTQVVVNLLGNAIKFTPSGGRIVVSCVQRGASLRVGVRDSGPGVSPDALPRVFDRYYHSGTKRGIGLGLTIAKGIVDAHGGTIGVESELGDGACFWFELPILATSEAVA